MKFITLAEKEAMSFVPKRTNTFRPAIESLEVGQCLQVANDECPNKGGPKDMLSAIRKATKRDFKVHHLTDRSGFVIERTA